MKVKDALKKLKQDYPGLTDTELNDLSQLTIIYADKENNVIAAGCNMPDAVLRIFCEHILEHPVKQQTMPIRLTPTKTTGSIKQ